MSDVSNSHPEKQKDKNNTMIYSIIAGIILFFIGGIYKAVKPPTETTDSPETEITSSNKMTIQKDIIDVSLIGFGDTKEIPIPGKTIVTIKKDINHHLVWNSNGRLDGKAVCTGNTFVISPSAIEGIFDNCELTELSNTNNTEIKLIITNTQN